MKQLTEELTITSDAPGERLFLLGNEATDEGSGIDEEIEGVLPLSGE